MLSACYCSRLDCVDEDEHADEARQRTKTPMADHAEDGEASQCPIPLSHLLIYPQTEQALQPVLCSADQVQGTSTATGAHRVLSPPDILRPYCL